MRPSRDKVYEIRNKIIESFQDAGYSPQIMLSILSTIVVEHLYLNDPSGECLEEFFSVIRKSFDEFKDK